MDITSGQMSSLEALLLFLNCQFTGSGFLIETLSKVSKI